MMSASLQRERYTLSEECLSYPLLRTVSALTRYVCCTVIAFI